MSATSTTSSPTPRRTPASPGCSWSRAPSRSARCSEPPSRDDPVRHVPDGAGSPCPTAPSGNVTRAGCSLPTLVSVAARSAPCSARRSRAHPPRRPPRAAGRRCRPATITPGVQMVTKGAQCTANFVFTDAAAACTSGTPRTAPAAARPPTPTAARPARIRSAPRCASSKGMSVATAGTTVGRGTLVYSSWITMRRSAPRRRPGLRLQRLRAGACRRPASVKQVEPVGAVLGRPHRARPGRSRPAAGSSATATPALRAGAEPLAPKTGASLGQSGGGWSHDVYTVTPGIPGDSGSGFLDAQRPGVRRPVDRRHRARCPASNGVGDLARELALRPDALRHRRAAPGRRDPGRSTRSV